MTCAVFKLFIVFIIEGFICFTPLYKTSRYFVTHKMNLNSKKKPETKVSGLVKVGN